MKRLALIVLLVVVAVAVGVMWWLTRHESAARELVLHGNLDLRQVGPGLAPLSLNEFLIKKLLSTSADGEKLKQRTA